MECFWKRFILSLYFQLADNSIGQRQQTLYISKCSQYTGYSWSYGSLLLKLYGKNTLFSVVGMSALFSVKAGLYFMLFI